MKKLSLALLCVCFICCSCNKKNEQNIPVQENEFAELQSDLDTLRAYRESSDDYAGKDYAEKDTLFLSLDSLITKLDSATIANTPLNLTMFDRNLIKFNGENCYHLMLTSSYSYNRRYYFVAQTFSRIIKQRYLPLISILGSKNMANYTDSLEYMAISTGNLLYDFVDRDEYTYYTTTLVFKIADFKDFVSLKITDKEFVDKCTKIIGNPGIYTIDIDYNEDEK